MISCSDDITAIALDSSRLVAQTRTSLLVLESDQLGGRRGGSWRRVWSETGGGTNGTTAGDNGGSVPTLCNMMLENHAVTLQVRWSCRR